MKLKDGFCTQKIARGQVMVPVAKADTEFRGIVRSNETAAFVVDCLKEETTREDILNKLKDTYDAPEDVMAKDMDSVIDKLRSIDAIAE